MNKQKTMSAKQKNDVRKYLAGIAAAVLPNAEQVLRDHKVKQQQAASAAVKPKVEG